MVDMLVYDSRTLWQQVKPMVRKIEPGHSSKYWMKRDSPAQPS